MYKISFDNLILGLSEIVDRTVTIEEIHKATGIHKNTLVYFRKDALCPRKAAMEGIFNFAVDLLVKESNLEEHKAPEIVSMLFFTKVLSE